MLSAVQSLKVTTSLHREKKKKKKERKKEEGGEKNIYIYIYFFLHSCPYV